MDSTVRAIVESVRERGEEALREYARRWDGLEDRPIRVTAQELEWAESTLEPQAREAILVAIENLRTFAEWQKAQPFRKELRPGIELGQEVRPLDAAGAYVPGGRYPLPSTLLMTVIPALVAGVRRVAVCGPQPQPITLAAAHLAGVKEFYRVGGAQAIAALALGTESIAPVDKIVGPGNAYVAAAKRLLAGEVAIDSVAGPSEVVVWSDSSPAPWIAADLLAQAEHDEMASAIWITTREERIAEIQQELERQLEELPTASVARVSLQARSAILWAEDESEAIRWINALAPEHLCLHDELPLEEIRHAGSIFLGPTSVEALGDYASGPNHVLPTSGHARTKGGLSVNDFLKVITVQRISPEGLESLATAVTTLARLEGLEAHARSVEVRR